MPSKKLECRLSGNILIVKRQNLCTYVAPDEQIWRTNIQQYMLQNEKHFSRKSECAISKQFMYCSVGFTIKSSITVLQSFIYLRHMSHVEGYPKYLNEWSGKSVYVLNGLKRAINSFSGGLQSPLSLFGNKWILRHQITFSLHIFSPLSPMRALLYSVSSSAHEPKAPSPLVDCFARTIIVPVSDFRV